MHRKNMNIAYRSRLHIKIRTLPMGREGGPCSPTGREEGGPCSLTGREEGLPCLLYSFFGMLLPSILYMMCTMFCMLLFNCLDVDVHHVLLCSLDCLDA
jgi:hypothetical protein